MKTTFFSKILLSLISVCLLLASNAVAGSVTLAWDANQPAPDGYRLYQRTDGGSYDYSSPVWQGAETSTTVDNISTGETCYFVVRAYQGTDESGDSNEVSYTATGPKPVALTYKGETI